ncbi:MAG: ribonuclease H-like domain-containing protein [Spirochaetia bacterium]|nr:ribonuclease H-like domain-containing protein [Spirochaetia bacterium]
MEINNDFLNRFRDNSGKKPHKKQVKELPGEVVERNGTRFLVTTTSKTFNGFTLPEREFFDKSYSDSLELLYGIRDNKKKTIADRGIRNLHDAKNNEKFSDEARRILSALAKDIHAVKDILGARFSPSHRLFFLLCAFFKPEELLFIDIETKSLFFETSIIEIGCGYFEGKKFTVKQFTCLKDAAEYEVLEEFGKLLHGKKAFVTFNGRTFDIPFIDNRISYYGGISSAADIPGMHNFDLLHFSRCCFRNEYDSYRLKSMEVNLLGKERDGDIEGSEVEIYYNNYIESGDPAFLEPIVYHNREDILAMVELFERIFDRWV